MECLDANAVQDLMSGALDDTTRASTVQHLDGCEDCRGLISLLARDVTRAAAIDTLRDAPPPEPGPEREVVRASDLAMRATERPRRSSAANLLIETMRTESGQQLDEAASPDVSLMLKSGTRQIGKMFGRYTLVDRIGAGAMGVVYRADDPGLSRRVALKLLHKPDAALTNRLIREAQSMAQVNHPNVVQVYDAGVSEGSTYIAMELVTGSSLRVWQQAKHTLPQIIEKYLAAGRGLAAAHAAGIIHRDFKPDNCLVGSDDRVRVTDFGLASARPSEDSGLDAGMDELELTHSGMVLGTPAYMAPEQFTGGNIDPRTDQFNFCVALYEALYKERPYKGKTFDELGDNVCDGKIRPPPAGTHVSRALRAIVLRGLSVRPGDRYPTMDALLEDLGADRARVWRNTSLITALLAAALGLGILADFIVRDRVSHENNQSFAATGVQIGRAFGLLASRFDVNANQMYHQAALREVTNYRDQFDFGLGDEADDKANREQIRSLLFDQDWSLWRMGYEHKVPFIIAVADYKGRMFFTNMAGAEDGTTSEFSDLQNIPWIKSALSEQREKTMVLQSTSDARLKESKLLGKTPTFQLAFFFARTLFLGPEGSREASGTLVQALDASQLVEDIRLDDEMKLSIVAIVAGDKGEETKVSDTKASSVPIELITAALENKSVIEVATTSVEHREQKHKVKAEGSIVEVAYGGNAYQVKAQVLRVAANTPIEKAEQAAAQALGIDNLPGREAPIGHVVMARQLGGVLSGFFPGARTVFAITALIMLGLAIVTRIQVRRLTR